jgi:hypothetical protein
LKYKDLPKLDDTLFSREFIIKIEGKEICRGRFWSGASSNRYSGITILDSLFKLDVDKNNTLHITLDYSAGGILSTSYPAIQSELVNFFGKHKN